MRTIQMLAVLALAVMSARANQFIQFSEIAFTSSMGEAKGFGGMSWDGKNSGGENVNFSPFIVDGMIFSPGLAGYVVFLTRGKCSMKPISSS